MTTHDSTMSSLEASLNIPQEMQKEVLRLEVLISTTLANLHIMNQGIAELHIALKEFLAEYIQEVKPVLDELETIRQEIAHLEGAVYTPKYSPEREWVMPAEAEGETVSDITSLYDRLVRQCVPEVGTAQEAKERFFALLGQAYQRKDIKTLTTIEHMFSELTQFPDETFETKLYRLSQKYDMLLQAYKEACRQKVTLEASPLYQLKNRVLQERIKGNDHIAVIKQYLRRKLYEENKKLLIKQQDKILNQVRLNPV